MGAVMSSAAIQTHVTGAWTTHHPIADQAVPAYWRPRWHVGHLVYQAGVPKLKMSSLTGGGFLAENLSSYAGREAPSWQAYSVPVVSAVGAGLIPSRPNFLTGLSNGTSTPQF